MTDSRYDAIVVGARCAGSPTAMLLARRGYRVVAQPLVQPDIGQRAVPQTVPGREGSSRS